MVIAELDRRLLISSEIPVKPVFKSSQSEALAELESNWLIERLKFQAVTFLSENPPTIGHGFSHLVKTARKACFLAVENDFGPLDSVDAYIAGLFHDIYRPAWTRDGREDHEAMSADVAKKLLTPYLDVQRAQKIANTIDNRDKRIIAGRASLLDGVVSIADKADISFQRAMAYLWACNQTSGNNEIPKLENIKAALGFFFYRRRAYQVFEKVSIFGAELGKRAYNRTSRVVGTATRWTLMGHYCFNEKLLQRARREVFCEIRYLKEAGATSQQIEQISAYFPRLCF
ncbi:MAG TPA: HD domain-containing protein [Clostridia bacterium]|nr:HD domain-containing protein [Clostridia bacterium]